MKFQVLGALLRFLQRLEYTRLPRKVKGWSLTSLQQRLVKTGGRLVKHVRY